MAANFGHGVFRGDVHVETHRRFNVGVPHELLEQAGRDDLGPPGAECTADVVGAAELLRACLFVDFDFGFLSDLHDPGRDRIDSSGHFDFAFSPSD